MAKITKDMLMGQILQVDENMAGILMREGMHCVGCPSSAGESLAEASMVHGMNADKLISDINTYLKDK